MSSSAASARAAQRGDALAIGQRVVVDPDPKCGVCGPCRAGRPASCENIRALGVFRDGALAPLVKAPADAVFPLSDAPSPAIASLIEPLACVVNGVNKANPRPGESAIIFGAGAIGCLFLAMFKAAGANPVIVVEPQAGAGSRRQRGRGGCRRQPGRAGCSDGGTSCPTAQMSSSTQSGTQIGFGRSSMPPWAAGSCSSA